jgi:hypothetical protein
MEIWEAGDQAGDVPGERVAMQGAARRRILVGPALCERRDDLGRVVVVPCGEIALDWAQCSGPCQEPPSSVY